MVADLWDVTYAAAGPKKAQKYPRPWPEAKVTSRHGNSAGRTPDQVKELLAKARLGLPEAPV